jgi:hypothetical protein
MMPSCFASPRIDVNLSRTPPQAESSATMKSKVLIIDLLDN